MIADANRFAGAECDRLRRTAAGAEAWSLFGDDVQAAELMAAARAARIAANELDVTVDGQLFLSIEA